MLVCVGARATLHILCTKEVKTIEGLKINSDLWQDNFLLLGGASLCERPTMNCTNSWDLCSPFVLGKSNNIVWHLDFTPKAAIRFHTPVIKSDLNC